MDTQRDAGEPGREGSAIDRVGLVAGVVLPLMVIGGVVAYVAANWHRLPAQYPSHWGLSGGADGWSDPASALTAPFLVAVVVNLPMSATAAFARLDLLIRKVLLPMGLTITALVGTLTVVPLSRVLGGETSPELPAASAAVCVAVALVIGVVAGSRLREGARRVPARGRPDPELPRGPLEELGVTIPQPRWLTMVLCVTVFAVGGTIAVGNPWMGLAVTLVMAPVLVAMLPFGIRVDREGVRIMWGPVRVRTVGIDEVAGARPEAVDPWRHGGIGYRLTAHGVAVVAKKGPGVRVTLGSGRHVMFGCPDEDAARRVAGVLNSAADARG